MVEQYLKCLGVVDQPERRHFASNRQACLERREPRRVELAERAERVCVPPAVRQRAGMPRLLYGCTTTMLTLYCYYTATLLPSGDRRTRRTRPSHSPTSA